MSTGRLTTHVLDTALGRPARGLALQLFRLEGETRRLLVSTHTNADGRCDAPLLAGAELTPGVYEIVFAAGAYLRALEPAAAQPFLDSIPVRFGVSDASMHIHVPLLLSPYGYSTYRGS